MSVNTPHTAEDNHQMRSFDDLVKFLIARDFKPKTCIDVGTCYGTRELFGNLPDAYHIYFEPVPIHKDRLELLTKKFPGEYHLMALSDRPGRMTLTYPRGKPQSAHLVNGEIADATGREVLNVPVSTLDHELGERALEGPILLKTDCQGFDLEVLRGGETLLKRVDIIVSEANLFGNKGDDPRPVLSDIVCYLAAQGFEVYDIVSYNRRPFNGALGFVDLAFVRRDGPLRASHRWD